MTTRSSRRDETWCDCISYAFFTSNTPMEKLKLVFVNWGASFGLFFRHSSLSLKVLLTITIAPRCISLSSPQL